MIQNPITPAQNNAPIDSTGLLSRVWYLFFVSVSSVMALTVKGAKNLTHIGAVPKVIEEGVVGESAITDTGAIIEILESVDVVGDMNVSGVYRKGGVVGISTTISLAKLTS